jgi:hypothetical protein
MHKMEYIKCFWQYIDRQTPVLCFYEVDKEEERYTTRNIDIFIDGNIEKLGEYEDFVSEAPCPTIEEINEMGEFKAFSITRQEFEEVWNQHSQKYKGKLDFPVD